jgi:S1-C subfamily serine protease
MFRNITICFLACALLQSCVSQNYGFHIPKNSRDQFVRIVQDTSLTVCMDDKCDTKIFKSSGSGVVVSSFSEGSYILTAAHVCQLELHSIFPDPGLLKLVKRIDITMNIVNLSQARYQADVVSLEESSDMCLLFVDNYWNDSGPVKISGAKPFEGERVYNVAAPVGIFYENTVPLLEGFYMGNEGLRAYYSIPAMGGSSGSPIFNLRGHLVGMIHSVNVMFPMVSISPKYNELKKFIQYSVKADMEKRSNKKEKPLRVVEPFLKGLGF